jgi:hypothetical protein
VVADRGVVADLVGAELVGAELVGAADRGGGGGDLAALLVVAVERAELLDVVRVAQELEAAPCCCWTSAVVSGARWR